MSATKTQQPSSSSPFSRLSRLGIGLGFRSQPSPTYTPKPPKQPQEEEDWYIAYNGPYEVPTDTRKRDSWGDVIEGEGEGQDAILNDAELMRRYGGGNGKRGSLGVGSSDGSEFRRGRAQSTSSGLTASTGTMDPHRRSMRMRSPHSSKRPNIASTYINLDAAGGIGESPMPRQRSSPVTPISAPGTTSATKANRTGLASYFFGGQPTSGSGKKPLRSPSSNQNLAQATSPTGLPGQNVPRSIQKEQTRTLAIEPPINNDDYYNSYYSTLINTPKHHKRLQGLGHVPRSSQATTSTKTDPPAEPAEADIDDIQRHHPYAYNFPATAGSSSAPAPNPRSDTDTPSVTRSVTSPLLRATHMHQAKDSISSGGHSHQGHPRPTLVTVKTQTGNLYTAGGTLSPLAPLKISVSTPNLRDAQQRYQSSPLSPGIPTGVDRWLSAETWCDAVFLPRPRFKMKQGNGSGLLDLRGSDKSKSSGRIVSPPPTPIARSPPNLEVNEKFTFPKGKEVAPTPPAPLPSDVIASMRPRRKLTKSKSASSLRSTKDPAAPTPDIPVPGPSKLVDAALLQRSGSKGNGTVPARLQKKRPKDLVLDPSALKSEPDLDRVLDEGDELVARRKEWQAHATSSFGNKRSRSLGRGRAKSLSNKEGRGHRKHKDGKPMGSIDFLTARTLLGNQVVAPAVVVREPGSQASKSETHTTTNSGTLTGTMSSKSHSQNTSRTTNSHGHSNSLAHSSSQKSSSQGHNRGHGRNGSWGQSALKLAKSTANGAICGADQAGYIPVDEKQVALEGAIKSNGTKVVRLNDQPDIQEEEDTVVIVPQTQGLKSPNPTAQNIASLAVGPGGPTGASPTPSGDSGMGVGLAFSTPPPSDDHSRLTYDIPDHPYAQGAVYPFHDRKPSVADSEHTISGKPSKYAGPHPSSPKVASIRPNVHDMSIRHRLPPQMTFHHPYAMGSRPEEGQYNVPDRVDIDQLQSRRRDEDADAHSRMAHAYARQSTGNPETLGVGEALSWRRGDTRFNDQEYVPPHPQVPRPASPQKLDQTKRHSGRRDSNASLTWPPRRKPVSYAEDEEPSSVSPYSPEFRRHASDSTKSSGSSPEHSPRPLGNVDDLDHFHDLFYKPEPPNPDATPSTEPRTGVRSGSSKDAFLWDAGSSSRSVRSGLSSLARKLTEEYEDQLEHMPEFDSRTLNNGQVLGKPRGTRPANIAADHETIFSDPSKLRAASPGPMETPVTLQFGHEQPDENVPEDVQSSRASSILEPASAEDDTFGLPLRFGAIAAVTTPPAVFDDRTHTPLVADEVVHPSPVKHTITDTAPQSDDPHRITSQMSLLPPSVTGDATRASYMTSTTEESRMSGLSDFPVPPIQNLTPAHMSIIHSYFGGSTPQNQVEDPLSSNEATRSEPRRNANFRMTFGGSEDMEIITPSSPRSPDQ